MQLEVSTEGGDKEKEGKRKQKRVVTENLDAPLKEREKERGMERNQREHASISNRFDGHTHRCTCEGRHLYNGSA